MRVASKRGGVCMSSIPKNVPEPTRVTVDEVIERLNRGEQFVFIDARNPNAWGKAETKLPGAIRIPSDEVAQHLNEIPQGRTIITYCT